MAPTENRLPVLSLFSGSGGLDLGFERAGFEPLLALDIDEAAVKTFNFNRLGSPARKANLETMRPSRIRQWWQKATGEGVGPVGIIGGPPCKAFSVSNVHKLKDDPRANLPLAYARILKAFNRRFDLEFFVFENVAGLGHRPHNSSLQTFIEKFEEAGFSVKPFYLDAVNFGVPQFRNRMFIVGFNDKRYNADQFAPPRNKSRHREVKEVIFGLKPPTFFRHGLDPDEISHHPNHWCMNPRSKKFENGALRSGEMLGRSFRRLNWGDPSWTVAYGHREVHVHPDGHRRLSVFEAMRLQGFPRRGYELRGNLSDQIRLVSDAVPPPLAMALARRIQEFIRQRHPEVFENSHVEDSGHASQAGRAGLQTAAPRSTSA